MEAYVIKDLTTDKYLDDEGESHSNIWYAEWYSSEEAAEEAINDVSTGVVTIIKIHQQ